MYETSLFALVVHPLLGVIVIDLILLVLIIVIVVTVIRCCCPSAYPSRCCFPSASHFFCPVILLLLLLLLPPSTVLILFDSLLSCLSFSLLFISCFFSSLLSFWSYSLFYPSAYFYRCSFPAAASHCCPPPPTHFYNSDRIPCCYPSGYPSSCFLSAAIAPYCSSHASNLSSFCFFSFSFSRCPFRLVFFFSVLPIEAEIKHKWCRHRQRPAVAYGIQTPGCCNVA